MPTINLNKWILLEKVGLSEGQLKEFLFKLKSEVSPVSDDEYSVEINADRVDMLGLGGVVRALKGISGKELGELKYTVKETDYMLVIDKVPQRPYALACVIHNVKLSPEAYLKEIIQFQEKLHETIGRKRKKVAIGIHDLRKIKSKIIRYSLVSTNDKIVPLGSTVPMTLSEVLRETEQGRKYGEISLREGRMPAIMDSDYNILSLPPVINSEETRLEPNTNSLFVDVTGTSLDAVSQTLDILATNFAELGAEIGAVMIKESEGTIRKSPLLTHNRLRVSLKEIESILGIKLSQEDAKRFLEMMREDVVIGDGVLEVVIPPYRVDIMNVTDVAEDIAMAYGYENFALNEVKVYRVGSLSPKSSLYRKLRTLIIGAGFQEIYTLILTKSTRQVGEIVQIENPISQEYDSVRNSLIWNMLTFMSNNQHARFPVRVFEIGEVVLRDSTTDTGYRNFFRVSIGVMDSKVSYESIQAPVHEILLALSGEKPEYKRTVNDVFMRGRTAEILLKGRSVGVIGEISPVMLNKFQLLYPVALAELDVDTLLEVI